MGRKSSEVDVKPASHSPPCPSHLFILNLTPGGVNNVRDGVGRGEQGGRGGEERHLPRHQAHYAHCPHPPLHPLCYGGILLLVMIVVFADDVIFR